MPIRLAACEPCRASKVACDHVRPVCTRCKGANRPSDCVYRERPFKRQRIHGSQGHQQHQTPPPSASNINETSSLPRQRAPTRRYPNPGYLGTSSHAAIFQQLPLGHENAQSALQAGETGQAGLSNGFGEAQILDGARLLERVGSTISIAACKKLIDMWASSGVNLALAGYFTAPCAEAVAMLLDQPTSDHALLSRRIFSQTFRPLKPHTAADIGDFSARFSGDNGRWETIGLFFTATSRAMTDIGCFRPLYNNRYERRALQQRAMHFADRCLEISLSLDCLNDLQLMLQYENFIAHSFVDGDQSYVSWRRLGDVISTLFALGYHDHIGNVGEIPTFLQKIRSAAFARAYSADKNMSIFLGRPPRMHRNFCRITVKSSQEVKHSGGHYWQLSSLSDREFDYMTETIWSAMCAWLKERVLDLRREDNHETRLREAALIKVDADSQWLALPSRFRLNTSLRLCERQPTERDFTVSARLNFLHVLFLIQMLLVPRVAFPDQEFINLSAAMLSLEVEALILKDHLAFSGTSIGWRVAYYGLPAAGILCLALLHRPSVVESSGASLSKVKQDLRILVTYVEMGALVHPDEPNYALLNGAAQTIKNLLETLPTAQILTEPTTASPRPDEFDWTPWITESATLDFELDFWNNLSEHPALTGIGSEATGDA